jgi:hypothetical protein
LREWPADFSCASKSQTVLPFSTLPLRCYGSGPEQQGFRQGSLARTAVADQGHGADGFGTVVRHDAVFLCLLYCSKFYPCRRGWSREGMRHSQSAVAMPMNASIPCSRGRPAKVQIEAQMVRLIRTIASHLTRYGMLRCRRHSADQRAEGRIAQQPAVEAFRGARVAGRGDEDKGRGRQSGHDDADDPEQQRDAAEDQQH